MFLQSLKIDNYKNTVNNNIDAYNSWVEDNLGIPKNVQNTVRVGGIQVEF